ncbi:MAG: hypothetical protein HKM88_07645 [Halobacteria archaeon]|nr:hypothetical protein [Halobacteria archaeon]
MVIAGLLVAAVVSFLLVVAMFMRYSMATGRALQCGPRPVDTAYASQEDSS